MRLRCLIVDDSEEFLASARRLLESQGLDIVASATTCAEAVRLAGTLMPDVVLVDVELGPEDGIELARELQERVPAVLAILTSAHAPEDIEELLAGGTEFPFVPKSSLGAPAIEEIVANARRER